MTNPRIGGGLLLVSLLFSAWGCLGSGDGVEPISIREVESHIRFLSHDLLEGRAVGSKGIAMAELYQEEFFRTFGLAPLFSGSFRQAFVVRGVRPDRGASLEISSPGLRIVPAVLEDFVVSTEREDIPEETGGDLVYAGYFIQAPEREWDDIKGTDLRGKVVLCEVNEPGNVPGGIFDGEDMTYYGRWTYKFEKAAELGAAGCLIIHNARTAAYGWEGVRNSFSGESFFPPDKNSPLFFKGWISGDLAGKILEAAKINREELLARAETKDLVPVPLGLRAKVSQRPVFRTVEAANVAGAVKAGHKDAKDRWVVITAHHDHLGKDESLPGDQIYNGAVDNCSATAAMLALAAYYAQRPEDLKVNLLFAGVTGEEKLFLGSDYLVRHLPIDRSSIAANINFEMTNVWGETEDVFAIGARHSDLDAVCREAAEAVGLRYIPERNGHLGFFFRSDQISFARAGIPAVWLHQGIVSRGADKGLALRKFEEYQKTKYHKVTDEIEEDWDLRGTLQIIDWAREIISRLAEREALPDFLPTSSFRRPAAGRE